LKSTLAPEDRPLEKAQLLAELTAASGPIEAQLAALSDEAALPDLAVAVCTLRIDEAAPALRDVLLQASLGFELSETEERLLFRGLHILGAARYQGAFRPLLQFLARPPREVDRLLGDAITESLTKIAAGMFDGDAEALFAAVLRRDSDEFVRDALLGAATFLTWEGRIDAARMRAFLVDFFEARRAPAGEHIWDGWQESVALLGLRDLVPMVEAAFRDELVEPMATSLDYFLSDLAAAERDPASLDRMTRAHLGYIEDALAELQNWPDPSDDEGNMYEPLWTPQKPVVNVMRHVGRNDPCPCGSGLKAKKCCL